MMFQPQKGWGKKAFSSDGLCEGQAVPRDQDLRHPGGAQLRWRPAEVRDEGDAGQWEAWHEVELLHLLQFRHKTLQTQ